MQDVMNDGSLVDADLHPIGYLQCEVNAPKVAPINFTRVFVSPMNRAMQTCIGMFKNHPIVANIKFTILPISREIWCGSQDIPQDVNVLLERYADGKPDAQGLKFDFSYIMGCHGDPQLWSLSTVTRMAQQTLIMNEISKHHQEGFPTPHNALMQALLTLFAEAGAKKLRFE